MYDSKNNMEQKIENNIWAVSENKKPEPLKQKNKRSKKTDILENQTEDLFYSVAENSNDIILIATAQGRILYINKYGSNLRGKNSLGNNAFDLLNTESHNLCKKAIEESLTTKKCVTIKQSGPNSTCWLVQFIPIKKSRYVTPVVAIICTEFTELERIKGKLERVNRALRVIGKCNEILVHSKNEKSFLFDICKAIVNVEGYCLVWIGFAEKDEGKTVRPVAHAGFEEGYLDTVNITWADTERGKGPTGTSIRTGKPQIMRDILNEANYEPWRSQALKRGYASSVALPMISEGQTIGALNVYSDQFNAFGPNEVQLLMELAGNIAYGIKSLRNSTECNRLNKELLIHRNKLRSLTMELALAEEHERHRIATGIHDEIGQKLAISKLELQTLQHQESNLNISTDLSRICDRINEILKEIRSLTFELSNPLLYHKGLCLAVKSWLEHNIQPKQGIKYEFISNLQPKCLGMEVRIILFQALREILTNIIKHAKANNVKIHLCETDKKVIIVIKDDGIGFKKMETPENSTFNQKGHFGLFNIHERIEQLGGRFNVISIPDQGTQMTITISKKHKKPILSPIV